MLKVFGFVTSFETKEEEECLLIHLWRMTSACYRLIYYTPHRSSRSCVGLVRWSGTLTPHPPPPQIQQELCRPGALERYTDSSSPPPQIQQELCRPGALERYTDSSSPPPTDPAGTVSARGAGAVH